MLNLEGPDEVLEFAKQDKQKLIKGTYRKRNRRKRENLTKEQVEVLKQAFDLFDADASEEIEEHELKDAMKALGLKANNEEVRKMIEEVDDDNSGTIDFQEFLKMMKLKMLQKKNFETELINSFEFFAGGDSNYITFENLRRVSEELQEQLDDEMLQHMIYAADIEGDNKVSLDEFMRVMRKMKLY